MQYNSGDEVVFAEQYPVDVNFVDEHEKIQKKVFTNWINYYVPNCIEKDIITELRDGTKLITLIEALTGHQLNCEKGKKLRRLHFINNVSKVLNYLESRKIKLVNINSTDIVDGNTCIILGLIWTLILRFHIHECFQVSTQDVSRLTDDRSKIRSPSTPQTIKLDTSRNENNTRQLLIDKFNRKFDLNITNFKSDWRDGFNILRMIDKLRPGVNALQRGLALNSNRERLDLALNLANDLLQVRKLLDAEDIDLDKPDDKSMITYLTQFLHKYPSLDINQQTVPFTSSVQPSNQQPVDTSKLFEESILSHECRLIQDFVNKVYITGINLQNLNIYSNQFKALEPIYKRTSNSLTADYQNKWKVIGDELKIAKEIEDWIANGEKIQNYTIPCSFEQCRQQLTSHCDFFDNDPLNLINQPVILIKELVSEYNQCVNEVNKWRLKLEKASKMWRDYEMSKNRLMHWLQEADSLLLKSHEPKLEKTIRRDHLENLKLFFSNREANEKILKDFVVACEDVLSTLPEEERAKPELRSTLTGLVNRFYNIINYNAPQHILKFEFDFTECDFFDKVRSLKNVNNDQLESSIVNDLVHLENLSTNYWNAYNDRTLLDKTIENRKEYEKYRKRLDDNAKFIQENRLNLIKDFDELERGVRMAKSGELKSEILLHNENLFRKVYNKLNNLKENANQLNLGNDLKELESRLDQLLLDLNLVIEDKIMSWCKVNDRSRLPSPICEQNECKGNNQMFLIQKIDFYSKLVDEFQKYEALIARSRQLIEQLNAKLDELANKTNIDEIVTNYKVCSNTIETSISKILEELREINGKLRDHNYLEELHANEILQELRRLKQRNDEQYGYLIENFSKDLIKQIETYRTKCEHCEIGDLRDLLIEVRNLNTTTLHKLEHINDALLHNKLLANLEDLIKVIDQKCNHLMNGVKDADGNVIKRSVCRITTEMTQKKIVEEIDGQGERSSQICEYNFKDLSNINPFHQSTTTTTTTSTTTKPNDDPISKPTLVKPTQTNFSQQFNLSQDNLDHTKEQINEPINEQLKKSVEKSIKKEIRVQETSDFYADSPEQQQQVPEVRRKESYELEAAKECERVEAEFKRNQKRIEEELIKERERVEEDARKQRLKLEEDARKERERIEDEMRKEKLRIEQEMLVEKDNELIRGLEEKLNELCDLTNGQEIDDLSRTLNNMKQICIQSKYIKDTQLSDQNKISPLAHKINQAMCKVVRLIESKIADDLGRQNFDLIKLDSLLTDSNTDSKISTLDENINGIEEAINLITTCAQCRKAFDDTIGWIGDSKEKINLLPYETIENLIELCKQFTADCDNENARLEDTSRKLDSDLNYCSIVTTPYLSSLEQLRSEYVAKCKEIFDDFANELSDKAFDLETQAKECESFDEFKRVNQELNKLRTNNEPVFEKAKQEPMQIGQRLGEIEVQLDTLSNKLEGILDKKAVELIHHDEFVLEPRDLKTVDIVDLDAKIDHYSKLQNEIENYKELLIDNDIFLENLMKRGEVNLKPTDDAIKACQTYAENISNQINNLQNSLAELNKNVAELGCTKQLNCNQAINQLKELKEDYQRKLIALIDDLVEFVRGELDELKSNEPLPDIQAVEVQLVDLNRIANQLEAKKNKLKLNDNSNVQKIQIDLNDYKRLLDDRCNELEEQARIQEEERQRKAEEERQRKAEEERQRKAEEERQRKAEEERQRKAEEERQRIAEEERQRKAEEERQRKAEEERQRIAEEERQRKTEEERQRKAVEERQRIAEEERQKIAEEERKRKAEEERQRKAEEERQRKAEEERQKIAEEERKRKAEEERIEKLEKERLEKVENKRLEEEKRRQVINRTEQENEFSSAGNLSNVASSEKDENDNLSDKKLKKLISINNKNQPESVAVVQVKMPIQKSKALLTNTSRMYSVEHYSELDSVDGEPIIELMDSDGEQHPSVDNSILEEIREMLRELKSNQTDSAPDLATLISEMKNIKNICLKVDNVRHASNELPNSELDEQLKLINGQLDNIFNVIKDILNTCIPNLRDNLQFEHKDNEQSEQQLIDNINLYTEVVTEFDKFDNLVNNNNDFMNEIKNQLRKIDNKSLDNKLVDYRDLLDKINSQINNVKNEMTNMNENLEDLKYKERLDRATLDELEKLRKLCEDHFENSIEDLYISYIPKMNNLENILNEATRIDDLKSILASMRELRGEINEKVDTLKLNGSPLIKNLLDLAEKLNRRIESKIRDNRVNEQLEQHVMKTKGPLKLNTLWPKDEVDDKTMDFTVHKTPDHTIERTEETIFKLHHPQSNAIEVTTGILQFTPPALANLHRPILQQTDAGRDQMSEIHKVLDQLRRLKDTLTANRMLNYEQIREKMNDLIRLITTIQQIYETTSPTQQDMLTSELNQVLDCLTDVTNDYIRKVCEKENTRSDDLFDNMSNRKNDLDQLLNNLRPRFESITEYRKFERLSETNQEKVDALNKVIDELTNLPINEKVKNLKDCMSSAEKFMYELTNDVNTINEKLKNLKMAQSQLRPNITIERFTEIKTTCRTDYNQLVKHLCKQANSEINAFGRILNDAKNPEDLKVLKKNVLNSTSVFEVEVTTADLMNDQLVRETMNEYRNLNRRIDEKINRLIKESKAKSPVNAKIKKETKSHLIKSNSQTLVGSPRIEIISTGNELIKFLKEMVIKLDKLIRESNSTENELKSYLTVLEEVCNQSNYVRENELQLSEELNLIDENLEIVRKNLIHLITRNEFDNLTDWRFEVRRNVGELNEINFKSSRSSNELNAKQILEKLSIDSNLINEYDKLNCLMNETHDWIKDMECKLNYLPLRSLEELLANYKTTIFSVEILKGKLLHAIEMFNLRLEDCQLDAELVSNPVLDELDKLKERFEFECKQLFDKFSNESMRKLSEYIKKCSNCEDQQEFHILLNEVKEYDVMNTNKINKIIQSTQESLDRLLGKLGEDANNNLASSSAVDGEQAASATTSDNQSNLLNSSTLSDSNNMIYVCDICIDHCVCVPTLEQTEIPAARRKLQTRTKRASSSARNSWNLSPEQLHELEQNVENSNTNSEQVIPQQTIEEQIEFEKFEIWLEAMSNTIDYLLSERPNLNETDFNLIKNRAYKFEQAVLYLKKIQQIKHALRQKFNHPANSNKAIHNQYRMLYLTLEREVCILKRQVEKLRVGTAINLPIQDAQGRVVCQNGVHLNHFCRRFRRNFFTRLFKITIPLQVILLTMFGISSLLPSSGDDYRCTVTNSLRNSLGPTYGYDSHPPV